MRSLSMLVMFSVGMLFSGVSVVQAHNDTFFNSPHELELKPSSLLSGEGVKLAKSYWLGGADIGLTFEGDDDETRCRAMGYTSDSCPGNETPVKFCGSNNQYHMCGCDSSVYKYTTENCPYGSVPDADVCDGYSRGCTCGESGYVWDEESGESVPFAEGTWKLRFDVRYEDASVTLGGGETFAQDGMTFTIDAVTVSPVAFKVDYTVDSEVRWSDSGSGQQSEADSREMQRYFENVEILLTKTDGTVLDLSGAGGSISPDHGTTVCSKSNFFSEILPMEEIESIRVGGVEFPLA